MPVVDVVLWTLLLPFSRVPTFHITGLQPVIVSLHYRHHHNDSAVFLLFILLSLILMDHFLLYTDIVP